MITELGGFINLFFCLSFSLACKGLSKRNYGLVLLVVLVWKKILKWASIKSCMLFWKRCFLVTMLADNYLYKSIWWNLSILDLQSKHPALQLISFIYTRGTSRLMETRDTRHSDDYNVINFQGTFVKDIFQCYFLRKWVRHKNFETIMR